MAGEQITFLVVLCILYVAEASISMVWDEDSKECDIYNCIDDSDDYVDDICIHYNDTESTIYLNPCSDGLECPDLEEEAYESECSAPTNSNPYAYPGEHCLSNINCFTFNCTSNKCQGQAKGEVCDSDEVCEPGLYCKESVCASLIKDDSKCTRDYECKPTSFCDISSKVCTSYFTLKSGTELTSCSSDLVDLRCKSGYCSTYTDEKGEIINECLDAVKSKHSVPVDCTEDQDRCISEDESVISKCECGYNSDAKAYCKLLPGDSDYADLIEMYKDWVDSEEALNCNTVGRVSLNCMMSYWDYADYSTLKYYYYKIQYWPQIQDNEDCVKEIKTYEYWDAKEEYSDAVDDDHALYLKLTAIFILLALS